ncbi:MAG TPA: prolyl-tRNA synthetase associated domain-containing protein [Geminicoccaceae bacterium]|nr:prolyl-tRNA synthetase associated domain-containing protein [Geminicoccus sp.]HMU48250.1 prolyl-tRNA synthetase associated domain-containing protein [Geminicoccaceae bacterium]
MLTEIDEILARLDALGIAAETFHHPAVFTVEESLRHTAHLPGAHVKNLFLKDKKAKLWLVTCRHDLRVDLNALSRRLGAARFSFGRPELLMAVLGVEPGSVTPLALVNDTDLEVQAVLDEALLSHDRVNCHPLRNTASTALGSADLVRFLRSTGHEPVISAIDVVD